MKIKIDFVTNSSSTAYVVFIPNKYKPDRDIAESIYSSNTMEEDALFGDSVFDDIEESFEKLKCGEYLWQYGDEGTSPVIYYTVLEMSNRKGFVVCSSEFSNEGNNSIFGMKEEQVVDILKDNIDLTDLLTPITQGVEICYEAEKGSH